MEDDRLPSIYLRSFSALAEAVRLGKGPRVSEWESHISSLRHDNHDRPRPAILCRIAHIAWETLRQHRENRLICVEDETEVSNSDQLFLRV
jgi:hypothetical protein